jgi:hypothetical protein
LEEFIIGLIILAIILVILFYGSVFFLAALAYGYWGLSIGMAPILWLILLIGVIDGLICAVRNARKAAGSLHEKDGEAE